MTKRLSLEERMEIFHALVTMQDVVSNVAQSRKTVAKKYDISESQLRQIEDEGIDQQWPPLEEEDEVAPVRA